MSFNPLQEQIPHRRAADGNGPPSDVEPSALLRKLLEAPRPSEKLPWLRNGEDGKPLGEFRVVVLTQEELDNCSANAEAYVRRKLRAAAKDGGRSTDTLDEKQVNQEAWRELYQSAQIVELLFCALRQEDDINARLFRNPEDLRKHLTNDELATLITAYNSFQHRYGPLWRVLNDSEIEFWIEALAKGAEEYPFALLSHGALAQVAVSLACRLASLQTGKQSPSQGCDASMSETSSP